MATITDLELTTTAVNSRTIINTNFDNLNTDKAELSGDTFTGLIQFSGTGHYGLLLNTLTTAQRDALVPANGNLIYNSTTTQIEFYENGGWVNLSGVSDATLTVKGIVELATTAEIDAGTAAGGTGAGLAIGPDQLAASIYGTQLPSSAQKTLLDSLTSTAAELNTLDGYTGDVNDFNEMATFFGATDISGAEAETLTDGSDAEDLHTHPTARTFTEDRLVLTNCFSGFIEDTSSGTITNLGSSFQFDGGSADTNYAALKTTGELDASLDFTIAFRAKVGSAGSVEQYRWGISGDVLTVAVSNNDVRAMFEISNGVLYATTATGAAKTQNNVTSGVTLTDYNVYKINRVGSNVYFYINDMDTPVATHSTNLPTSSANRLIFNSRRSGAGGTDPSCTVMQNFVYMQNYS